MIEEESVGSRCETRIWQERFSKSGNRERVVVDNLREGPRHDAMYAMVVSQVFTKKHALESTILSINSPHILRALRDKVKSYPTVPSDFSEPFDMESPFRMLYHSWELLDEYRQNLDDDEDEARMHLNLLFEFMEADMGVEKQRCEAQARNGQVEYWRLWTLYQPGNLLLTFEDNQPWLLRAVKTAYEENKMEGRFVEVHCTYTDHDGSRMGRARHVIKVRQREHFASENPAYITDLPIYPRKYLKGDDMLEDRLEERGLKFLDLCSTHIREYEGIARHMLERPISFYDPRMSGWPILWEAYYESGRMVIDRKTYQEDHFQSRFSIQPATLEGSEQILCPPYVYGFSLTRMEWCKFYLLNISGIDWQKDGFDDLVMEEKPKKLLRALVVSHLFPADPRNTSRQKGKGLVVLLHGTPGSGKTLTAEMVAEVTGKALIRTSLAELNKENRPWYFERRLSRILRYATIWQAVVLLDEADVFLEARRNDVADATERNALVAVFLKHLEYFGGIVFLTTNRIEVFDSAMRSRIHLVLGYSRPVDSMRKSIWRQCLLHIPQDQVGFNVEAVVGELARAELNGREITNAIHTAQTLARFENKPLQQAHLRTVLDLRTNFSVGSATLDEPSPSHHTRSC